MKKIVSAILAFALLTVGLCGCGTSFVKNDFSLPENKESVPAALDVYGGEDIGFSFLYPYGMRISWTEEDGACISDGSGDIPYVLVKKTAKSGMTPEKYFKSSDKQILNEFESVQSSTIHQVPLGDKTLYMTRYQCSTGGLRVIIDRYIEIYKNCYIQYTAVTNTEDEMNTALYYAASTLSPEEGKYFGEYSNEFAEYSQEDTGISLKLPEMLDVKELTIGYFASCSDTLILAVVCTEDDYGNPIYNRQNFMDCAANDSTFVAGYLGADSVTFDEGSKKTVNGVEFYAYPMTMQTGAEQFTGEIYLANAHENGCVVLCYAVKTDSPRFNELNELCLESVDSFEF